MLTYLLMGGPGAPLEIEHSSKTGSLCRGDFRDKIIAGQNVLES